MSKQEHLYFDKQTRVLQCEGKWDIAHLPHLQEVLTHIAWPKSGSVTFDVSHISKMDSAGAWLIDSLKTRLEKQSLHVDLKGLSEEHEALLALVSKKIEEEVEITPTRMPALARIGCNTVLQANDLRKFLSFVGFLTFEALRISKNPSHIRFKALAAAVFQNGFQALPIIALLSFMIGVVIAYQMGLQLQNYGANIYIVDLLGLSILREFGPLITAIMVAGRTGSSYTAQLGIMKLNQEIDALDTMGVTPAELLLLPRIIGLVIALPLLTIWADIFGVFGGMVMSNGMLNISWYDFMQRFPRVIPLRALLIGVGKSPVFALLIASIGCYQGMAVEGSAASVGKNTTRSVVLAIFFIIVADAIFSVIFSKLKL
jgi:phospholipid/cholesterol/gamma-HCH transport system permease protein